MTGPPADPQATVFGDSVDIEVVLIDACQLFDGWHQDGTAWSEWDEQVRQRVGKLLRRVYDYNAGAGLRSTAYTPPALPGGMPYASVASMTTAQAQSAHEKLALAGDALAIAIRLFKRLHANPVVGARDNRHVLPILRDALAAVRGPTTDGAGNSDFVAGA